MAHFVLKCAVSGKCGIRCAYLYKTLKFIPPGLVIDRFGAAEFPGNHRYDNWNNNDVFTSKGPNQIFIQRVCYFLGQKHLVYTVLTNYICN